MKDVAIEINLGFMNGRISAGDAAEAVSDTGELRRNWEQGVFSIDTPMTQAAMGWIGGKKLSLGDVDIEVTTRSATVAVQSLEGKPISQSSRILISLGAQSAVKAGSRGPFHWQPVEGRVTVRAPKGLAPQVSRPPLPSDSASAAAGAERRATTISPDVQNVQQPAAPKDEISINEAKLREVSSNLGPNHPTYIRMQAEIAALNAKREQSRPMVTATVPSPSVAAESVGRPRELTGKTRAIPYTYTNGRYVITLERGLNTNWLVLK